MKTLYTAVATTRGGREGRSETDDGKLKVELAKPAGLGGKGKEGTNPEQLFACGYSACFGSAIDYVASLKKIPLQEISVKAKIDLMTTPEGAFKLGAELTVSLPGVPKETAQMLVNEAHRVCPYSNATRGNVDVKLSVV